MSLKKKRMKDSQLAFYLPGLIEEGNGQYMKKMGNI